MLGTFSQPADITSTLERRSAVRQRVWSLVYLDAGSDNGGIVLNVSDTGLALQAANPFEGKARLVLRVRPPNSSKKIEMSAEMAWLSETKSAAGFRFVDLPESARAEIAGWLAVEASAGKSASNSIPSELQLIPRKQITEAAIPRREKWSIVLAESASQGSMAKRGAPNPGASADSSVCQDDFQRQPDTMRKQHSEDFRHDSAKTSRNLLWVHPLDSGQNDSPADLHIPPKIILNMLMPPDIERAVLPVNDQTDTVIGSVVAHLSEHGDETADASAPSVPSPSSQVDSPMPNWFRRWPAIATLCGCTALFFLILGMGFSRWRSASSQNLNSHENAPALVANPAPGIVVEGPAPELKGLSGKTRHNNVVKIAKSAPMENLRQDKGDNYNRGVPTSSHGGKNGIAAAEFSSPSSPVRPVTTNNIQNASAPPLSFPPSKVSGMQGLTANPIEYKPPPAVSIDRRIEGYLLYRVEPLYPPEAKERHIEGTVTMRATIGEDGKVRSLRVLSGPDLLVPAALEAAREWSFMPALLNGHPIEEEKNIKIVFRLPQ
ncbi:MAG: TonB family protein [Candidatus Acidiferrales bacterium]